MIQIDYIAGTHGNFLRIVLNSLVNGVDELPFNHLGASHKKIIFKNYLFDAKHYSVLNMQDQLTNVIKINFHRYNLLKVCCLVFKRGGNFDIELDTLEIDTVNKLKDTAFKDILPNLYTSYQPQLIDYATTPNVPRYILREFFKFGFLNPEQNGLVMEFNKMTYGNKPCFVFEFDWFYGFEQFCQGVDQVFKFFNIDVEYSQDTLRHFHDNFIKNNQYVNIDHQAQEVLNHVLNGMAVPIPRLHLMQESWLNAELEKRYQIEMPFRQSTYFEHTQEIINYIHQKRE